MRGLERIPGGSQLYSKRPDRFPWPSHYSRAKGASIWAEGREFIDFSSNGVGACPLGYADPDVNARVKGALNDGSASTLNPPEEVELAELLCQIHPWAERVRFACGGGEAMSIAVRLARAATGRSKVAFCGYHGWCDWYLAGADKDASGVPKELDGTATPFDFNDLPHLPGGLAAIVLEVQRGPKPIPEFLSALLRHAARTGAVLIFDEITSGFRLTVGGVHKLYGVEPDIAVFGKGMGNGIPISAVIGRTDVMESPSFISSTAWSERLGPAAALATIRKFSEERVHEHLVETGQAVQAGWQAAIERHGIDAEVSHPDMPPLSRLTYRDPELQSRHCELMLERGYLDDGNFYATYAHRPGIVWRYLDAVEEVFPLLERQIVAG